MKYFATLMLICTVAIANCAKTQIKGPTWEFPHYDKLTDFFYTCNNDIQKAVKVIADNKMAANLTHLRKMDTGGKKYYLLERENLSDMIMSVTEGTYSDLILINSSGLIIYTMKNDDIFGKHVKYQLNNTAVSNCFNKTMKGLHIEDVSMFPNENGTYALFASFPDKADGNSRGIFIIQINIEIIESIIGENSIIVGTDGKYRVCKNKDNILKPYEFFTKIDISSLENMQKNQFEIEKKKYIYSPFNYNSLNWIVIYSN